MKRQLIYYSNIPVQDKVEVTAGDGSKYHCDLESVSKDGLHLKCNRDTLDKLLPNASDIAPKQAVTLEVSFSLSMKGKQSSKAAATSEVISIRRLSRDGYQLSLRFKEMTEKDFNQVESYVDEARQLRTNSVAKVA